MANRNAVRQGLLTAHLQNPILALTDALRKVELREAINSSTDEQKLSIGEKITQCMRDNKRSEKHKKQSVLGEFKRLRGRKHEDKTKENFSSYK